MEPQDWIELGAWRVDCILGVLEREQKAPQPLEIDVRLGLDLQKAGDGDALDKTVDYAAVLEQCTTIALQGRWRLLESMGLAMLRLLLAPPAPGEPRGAVSIAEVALRKPEVLGGRAIPCVRMRRDAAGIGLSSRSVAPGVLADVLCETPGTAAYRLHVDGGSSFVAPPNLALHVIAGMIGVGEDIARPGQSIPRGQARTLANPGRYPVCLLGVSTSRMS
jgi:dihydroneopterin aldolase